MRKFNTMLVIALSFVGFSASAETVDVSVETAEVSAEVSVETNAPEASETREVATEVEVEAPSQE